MRISELKAILTEGLLNSIPKEKYKKVIQEIKAFYEEYLEVEFNIRQMKKGWSVRKIHSTKYIKEIYKIRVNKKDRVLFTFGKYVDLRDECNDCIVFLEFCAHDDQARRARVISSTVEKGEEALLDQIIDEEYREYQFDISQVISRVVSVEDMNKMIEGNDERVSYYLNDEQYQLINTYKKPLFIFGSAGSGKTTVAINKAYQLSKMKNKVGYITYSDHLVKEAKANFKHILEEDLLERAIEEEKQLVEFNTFNKHVLKIAQKSTMITYGEFQNWYQNSFNKYNEKEIDIIEVYREIRGVIKGVIPINWIEISIPLEQFEEVFITYLVEKNYAIIEKGQVYIQYNRLAELSREVKSYIKREQESYLQGLAQIYEKLNQYLYETKILEEEIYLNLPREYSLFHKEQRREIYSIACSYQNWLISNNKIDENDMARIAIKRLCKDDLDLYDYIICDEVQDLTEMQIYYLLMLVKDKENLVLCGDFNQTINPTFFDTGRVKAIFMMYNGIFNLEPITIKSNYRSAKKIVYFANELTKLKIEKLGKHKKNDYLECAVRNYEGEIYLLNVNSEKTKLRREIVELLNERAYVDLLVPNEYEKQLFHEAYKEKASIFTVAEYKGLENNYVICYNLFSRFKDKWDDIFIGNNLSEVEKRYYFNLLYVAITRAKERVLLVEEDISKEILDYFKECIIEIDELDYERLDLERTSTTNEHYNRGKYLEENSKYEEAIEAYKHAEMNTADIRRRIQRCEWLVKASKGLLKEAAEGLKSIQEFDRAIELYLQLEDYLSVIEVCIYDDRSYMQMIEILNEVGINPLEVMLKSREQLDWEYKFSETYQSYLNNGLTSIKDDINNITGLISEIR